MEGGGEELLICIAIGSNWTSLFTIWFYFLESPLNISGTPTRDQPYTWHPVAPFPTPRYYPPHLTSCPPPVAHLTPHQQWRHPYLFPRHHQSCCATNSDKGSALKCRVWNRADCCSYVPNWQVYAMDADSRKLTAEDFLPYLAVDRG